MDVLSTGAAPRALPELARTLVAGRGEGKALAALLVMLRGRRNPLARGIGPG